MARYPEMSRPAAQAALEEFLAERAVARRHLRGLTDDAVPLDGSVESLGALWPWVKRRLTRRTADTHALESTPTWSRYWLGDREPLSLESLRLLDGVVSYVGEVLCTAYPAATWVVADDPHPRFLHRNQPALRLGSWEQPVPTTVANLGRQVLGDWPPSDDRLAGVVTTWLAGMRDQGTRDRARTSVPPYEVTDLRANDDVDRFDDFDLEITLDDELLSDGATTIDQLSDALGSERGVLEVHAEDRDVLLVRAPGWDVDRLMRWLAARFQREGR